MSQHLGAYLSYVCDLMNEEERGAFERGLADSGLGAAEFGATLDMVIDQFIAARLPRFAALAVAQDATQEQQNTLKRLQSDLNSSSAFAFSDEAMQLGVVFPSDPRPLRADTRLAAIVDADKLSVSLANPTFEIDDVGKRGIRRLLDELRPASAEGVRLAVAFAAHEHRNGRSVEALAFLREAEQRARDDHGHFSRTRAILVGHRARILDERGDQKAALEAYREASNVMLVESEVSDPQLHELLAAEAKLAHQTGDLARAKQSADALVLVLEAMPSRARQEWLSTINALIQLTSICHDLRQTDEATAKATEAVTAARLHCDGERGLARALCVLGTIREARNEISESVRLLVESFDLYTRLQERSSEAVWACVCLARVLSRLPFDIKRIETGRDILLRAKQIANSLSSARPLLGALVEYELSLYWYCVGLGDQAERAARDAAQLAEMDGQVGAVLTAAFAARVGDMLFHVGRFAESRDQYLTATSALKTANEPDARRELWLKVRVAKTWAKEGQPQKYAQMIREVSDAVDAAGIADYQLANALLPPRALDSVGPMETVTRTSNVDRITTNRTTSVGVDMSLEELRCIEPAPRASDALLRGFVD
jgi:tetratricopeptide (TPR) repeat protein